MSNRSPAVEGLRRLCALLSPFATREALLADWPGPSLWPAMVAQADAHRLLTALAVAIARHDLGDRIDADLADLLASVAVWNAERNEGFRRQMLTLTRGFNAAGLSPVWLKGALRLLAPEGPAQGRMMLDLDLWLPREADRRAAVEVLEGLGYATPEADDWADKRHLPPYFHPAEMARVEVHRTLVDPAHGALLPPDEAALAVEWLEWEGLRIGRLDPLSRAVCSFAQCTRAGYRHMSIAEVPLMKTLDFVQRIHDDFGGRVPSAFVERARMAGWELAARRFLTVADVFFGLASPLEADPGQVRLIDRFTARPRWHHTLKAARSLFGPGGRAALRRPRQAPLMVVNYMSRLFQKPAL